MFKKLFLDFYKITRKIIFANNFEHPVMYDRCSVHLDWLRLGIDVQFIISGVVKFTNLHFLLENKDPIKGKILSVID